MANNEIEFYIGNEKKILKQREKIFLPLNENKYLELILRVREFTDLWKYLENERLIYCQKVDHTVFLCKTNSEIFKEILYPIKEIYDKEIIKSTRVNDFDGLTINEAIRRFEHRMAWLGTIITLLIPILTFLLSAYKENIIHFINNPGSFIIKLFYQFF
jgi:hypothetical protein